ncbi:MAG: class I SAM-dependent methyltransferase [Lysobacterales bacterium]
MTHDATQPLNPLQQYFNNNEGRLLTKWRHYLDIYHRHFERYRGRSPTVVEIGVYHGGSLQMWKQYFGSGARIVGVDVNPRLRDLGEEGIEIVIGDQGDHAFLRRLAQQVGPIDILIDDGGHTMPQQIGTVEALFGAVATDGVILIEDTHTSYWREYGGGLRAHSTFMQFAKHLIDELNAYHSRDPQSFAPGPFTHATRSMHFYDSVVVIEKGLHPRPEEISSGSPSFPVDTPMNE